MQREDVHQLFDLTDRVAIVTGGTRGLGRAIAEGFVAAGAKVVVASRKADACAETQAALESTGGEALGVPTHLGELEQLEHLVHATVDRFGAVDIVVNNAATALAMFIGDLTPEAWDKSLNVNLRGPVFLVQNALPHLKESQHGVVVNVISVGAFMFSAYTNMYAAAKAGLMAYTRSMAAEFAPHGIRINALAPGSFDTDMMRNNDDAFIERSANASLMKRIAKPEELIGPALYLASDASSFMTGQVLIVDGGMTPH